MAVTHPTASRNAIAEAIRTIANANGTPHIIIGTSSLALPSTGVLVDITIPDFGAASSGTISSASTGSNATATATGTAAIAIVTDGSGTAGTEAFRGAVGVGSGEIQISSTSISTNDTVTITGATTWTAPS